MEFLKWTSDASPCVLVVVGLCLGVGPLWFFLFLAFVCAMGSGPPKMIHVCCVGGA